MDGAVWIDNDNETINKTIPEDSRGELVDESSTVLFASKSIHGIPGSGILS